VGALLMLEDVVAALPVSVTIHATGLGELRDACMCWMPDAWIYRAKQSRGMGGAPKPSGKRRLQIKLTNLEKKTERFFVCR